MIARITEHTKPPDELDLQCCERFRACIASQPGFCGGYHLFERPTRHAIALTLWESEEALAAASRAIKHHEAPADGRISRQSRPRTRVVEVAAIF